MDLFFIERDHPRSRIITIAQHIHTNQLAN